MTYWLNLFTGTTWREFQSAGAKVSGFREHSWKRAQNIKPGDIFLCYMVGVKRWVGLLEVKSERFKDESPIYAEEIFPIRFRVNPIVMLTPEHGVPMESLKGKLTYYPADMDGSQWSGHVRSSHTKYNSQDGQAIFNAIREADQNPVPRAVDPIQLKRSANLYKVRVKSGDQEIERVVSIPKAEEEESPEEMERRAFQAIAKSNGGCWTLALKWASKFENTNRTIEEIDVLWLSGQCIVSAFEVEHTTSIFSGLLRMSDLLTMQHNLDIKLYIVGPDERYSKFENEVARPTFAARPKPLHALCRFLPYSKLCTRLEEARNVIRFLRPEFLDEIAELYSPEEDVDAT